MKIKISWLHLSIFLNLLLIGFSLLATTSQETVIGEQPLDRIASFELLIDSPKYCAFKYCIDENMTWSEIRYAYYSFKSYSSHMEHTMDGLIRQVCNI